LPIPKPKNILVAPLDWGAGHTTRCIPIIAHLLQLGHNPILAGNAAQQRLVNRYFDRPINSIYLEGYNVTYSAWNRFAQAGILSQLPRLLNSIKQENEWLQQQALLLQLDGIISDNRYGLYHPAIPCVIMTHQLRIMTGLGSIADNLVQQLHYRYLNRFNTTWIADNATDPTLAGDLAHPAQMPDNFRFIGPLSRLADIPENTIRQQEPAILILLSGPEPQRTTLSRILWEQALQMNERIVFVEGTEAALVPENIPPHITHYRRLDNKQLITALQQAAMVVCRSGYSTIMDLTAINKKAILIPTPGQTEQQYLGKQLHKKGILYCTQQTGFDLKKALHAAASFPYLPSGMSGYQQHKEVIGDWLNQL
jgi:UDP:flavonoid glycosyltransferase YjiC (YdhE family)